MHTHSYHGFGEELGGFDSGGFDSVRRFRSRIWQGLGRLSRRAIASELSDATTIIALTLQLRFRPTRTGDMALLATLETNHGVGLSVITILITIRFTLDRCVTCFLLRRGGGDWDWLDHARSRTFVSAKVATFSESRSVRGCLLRGECAFYFGRSRA